MCYFKNILTKDRFKETQKKSRQQVLSAYILHSVNIMHDEKTEDVSSAY